MTSYSTLSREAVLSALVDMGELAISEHCQQSCGKARVMHERPGIFGIDTCTTHKCEGRCVPCACASKKSSDM